MVQPVQSTSQWRKLIYSKHYDDRYGAIWQISAWKGFFWMVFVLIVLIIGYSFLVSDQQGYLQNAMFYAIITVVVAIIVWVLAHVVWKTRKIFIGFMLAWILILGLYLLLTGVYDYALHWMPLHYGMTTWIVITFLAALGSTRIDKNLDKNDVFYGSLVFIVLTVVNAPVFENGGFLAQLDSFYPTIIDTIGKFINFGNESINPP